MEIANEVIFLTRHPCRHKMVFTQPRCKTAGQPKYSDGCCPMAFLGCSALSVNLRSSFSSAAAGCRRESATGACSLALDFLVQVHGLSHLIHGHQAARNLLSMLSAQEKGPEGPSPKHDDVAINVYFFVPRLTAWPALQPSLRPLLSVRQQLQERLSVPYVAHAAH